MTTQHQALPGQEVIPFNFNDVPLYAVQHEDDLWLAGEDIGAALGYANPSAAIRNIFKRNQIELERYSCRIKLIRQVGVTDAEETPDEPENGVAQLRDVRVFNEEGVMILTMLSSQPKAAEFRAWAVEVLKAYRHGNLVINTPAGRQRLLEVCIKEARYGNPVAVHTLITQYGYPEHLRQEIKHSLLRRAARFGIKTPELVDWFIEAFLPRLREEVHHGDGPILQAIKRRPPHCTNFGPREHDGKWALGYRASDLFQFILRFAEEEGVDTDITSQLFTKWLNTSDDKIVAAGWLRVLHKKSHGWQVFRLVLQESSHE